MFLFEDSYTSMVEQGGMDEHLSLSLQKLTNDDFDSHVSVNQTKWDDDPNKRQFLLSREDLKNANQGKKEIRAQVEAELAEDVDMSNKEKSSNVYKEFTPRLFREVLLIVHDAYHAEKRDTFNEDQKVFFLRIKYMLQNMSDIEVSLVLCSIYSTLRSQKLATSSSSYG